MIGSRQAANGWASLAASRRLPGLLLAVLANIAMFAVFASARGPAPVVHPPERITWFLPAPEPVAQPTQPEAEKQPKKKELEPRTTPTMPEQGETPSNAITLPPATSQDPSVPLGFASLLGRDPCNDPQVNRRPPGCPPDIAPGPLRDWYGDRVGDRVEKAMLEQMARTFGPQCNRAHDCLPMPTKTLNGLNPVPSKSPMSSGPAGLGGINDLTGRLPPPNSYHVDPGFGD